MDAIYTLLIQTLSKVWVTFTHNWPFLLASILIAVLLKLYLKPDKITSFLIKYQRAGVIGATVAAVATPLCSCGSTAVVLGMMASMIPWAPVVAFMVASPLTSPQELIYSAGLFGWPFALAFFAASILLGLLGGLAAGILEKRGWLANQSRFDNAVLSKPVKQPSAALRPVEQACCGPAPTRGLAILPLQADLALVEPSGQAMSISAKSCCGGSIASSSPASPATLCACTPETKSTSARQFDWRVFLKECWAVGGKLMLMFLGFAFIGYFLNGLIPAEWVSAIFGSRNAYSIPLAATLGLPLYINTEASLPLVRAMLDNGMSQGAALAFLITGAGTSIGALGGALTIARWRVIALVIGVLWIGAILMGYLYNVMIGLGWV